MAILKAPLAESMRFELQALELESGAARILVKVVDDGFRHPEFIDGRTVPADQKLRRCVAMPTAEMATDQILVAALDAVNGSGIEQKIQGR